MIGAVMAMAMLAMAILAIQLGAAVIARHRAAAAADLAALAGASAAVKAMGSPCAAAAEIVTAGGGRLDSCEVSGWEVRVVVSVASGVLGQRATARARAGPDLAVG